MGSATLEQTVNIGFKSNTLQAFFYKLRLIAASCLLVLLSACVPSGEQDVNTSLFKSKEDMSAKTGTLKPGMAKKKVFETLGIKPEKFERMSTAEVQMAIYGNSQVHGTPEQLEKFREKILSYEGYALPYREIKSSSSLGFGKMKVEKTGYDLKLVLIFEKGKLFRAGVEGTEEVNQQEDQYLWDTLIRRGIGFAF